MAPTELGFNARLVWDGGDAVWIPPEMGSPRRDQMQGTPAERLSELACRACYDSLGRGRSSEALHAHILEVKHLSVYEHPQFTIQVRDGAPHLLLCLLNRKGVWVELAGGDIRITTNLRAVLEWDRHSHDIHHAFDYYVQSMGAQSTRLGNTLQHHAHLLAPMVVQAPNGPIYDSLVVEPETSHERWASLFLAGSRGFSHEQVRHGDETAISHRSTRYCDESESPRVTHPLIHAFLHDESVPQDEHEIMRAMTDNVWTLNQSCYKGLVGVLQRYLTAHGMEGTAARKQARGAARGYLGHALYTEMIFSASAAQWRWMLHQRAAEAADAEPRAVYELVLPELQRSTAGCWVKDLRLAPSSDGLGMVLENTN